MTKNSLSQHNSSTATEISLSRHNSSVGNAGAHPLCHLVATQFLCGDVRPPSLDHILSWHYSWLRHSSKRILSRPKPPSPSPKPCCDTKFLSLHGVEGLYHTSTLRSRARVLVTCASLSPTPRLGRVHG